MTDRTNVSMIGKSIVIKGELSSAEDLVINGQVEGNHQFEPERADGG